LSVTFGKSTAQSSRFVRDVAEILSSLVERDAIERMVNSDQHGVGCVAGGDGGGGGGGGDAYIDFGTEESVRQKRGEGE